MKKVFLILSMALFTIGSFASNDSIELVEDFDTCTLNIVYYNSNGSVDHIDTFTSNQPNLESCQAWHLSTYASQL